MARHVLVFLGDGRADHHTAAIVTAAPPLLVLLVVVAAVVVSLCARSTHGVKLWNNKHRKTSTTTTRAKMQEVGGEATSSRKHLFASLSGIGAMEKMVSWSRRSPAQVGSGEEEEAAVVDDQEAMWRKDILMGVKCRPLEFSGHITLDCDGNGQPLSPPPPAPVAPLIEKAASADIAEALTPQAPIV